MSPRESIWRAGARRLGPRRGPLAEPAPPGLIEDHERALAKIEALKLKLEATRRRLEPGAARSEADPPPGEGETAAFRWTTFKRVFAIEAQRDAVDGAPPSPLDEAGPPPPAADQAAVLSRARALRRAGRLQPAAAGEAASALLGLGLVEEALDILLDAHCAPAGSDLDRVQLLADGWLALGVRSEARRALRMAETLAPGRNRALVRALGAAETLQNPAAPPSWAQAWKLIRLLIRRRHFDVAAAGLGVLLQSLEEPAAEQLDQVLDAALALLRAAGRDGAVGLFTAMAGLYRALGRSGEHRRTLAQIRGRTGPPLRTDDPSPRPSARLTACTGEALAAAGCWRAAMAPLVETCADKPLTREGFIELARCVGRDVLSGLDLRFRSDGPARVFDVFPFNGEFDVLRLKLETMSPWVDRFVIVEAAATFTGQPKPLTWPGRSAEFAAFADKIVYLPIEAFPEHLGFAWSREFFQRDSAVRALGGLCAPNDIVIISDADEILAPHVVADFKPPLAGVDLRFFNFFLNCERRLAWPHVKTTLARASLLARNGLSYLRLGAAQSFKSSVVFHGGWHFSNLGAPSALALKMRSYSHTENAHLGEAHFGEIIERIRRGETVGDWRRLELDDSFPAPLRTNPAAYARLLL